MLQNIPHDRAPVRTTLWHASIVGRVTPNSRWICPVGMPAGPCEGCPTSSAARRRESLVWLLLNPLTKYFGWPRKHCPIYVEKSDPRQKTSCNGRISDTLPGNRADIHTTLTPKRRSNGSTLRRYCVSRSGRKYGGFNSISREFELAGARGVLWGWYAVFLRI